MSVQAVIDRLKDQVGDLKKVEGASAFSALVASNKTPPSTPVAFVYSSGLTGGTRTETAGAFIQDTTETVSVALMLRSTDRLGHNTNEPLESLKADVLKSLCGWQPDAGHDAFGLKSGKLVSFNAGLVTYTLSFSIADQLRILT